MKLLIFSDIHGDTKALQRLIDTEADCYIAAGDLVNWGRGLDALAPILAKRQDRLWLLPGNHEHASDIARYCDQFGFKSLHGKSFEAGGRHIAGLGHSNPTPFNTPGESSEEELGEGLSAFAGLAPLILVCHCPPKGTALDEAGPGRHFGSAAVRDFVDKHQPEWLFCGHIHEAAGRTELLGRTRSTNVGKQGYLLEL